MELKEIEEKAKAYDEASKWMEGIYPTLTHEQQMEAEAFFQIFKESEDEKIRKELIAIYSVGAKANAKTGDIPDRDIVAWLEKQGEQKPADKVEPKFKDGDVLNSPSYHLIWIYKDNEHYYTCLNMNYVTKNVAIGGSIKIPSDACPATKEQNNALMKAMVDAGYTFDFEKKELKKIEQKPAWSEEDEKTLERVIRCIENHGYMNVDDVHWLKSFKDRVQSQPKQEWSEEDNERIEQICEDLKCGLINFKSCRAVKGLHFEEIIESNIDWLKSLRPQSTWKPSDEQLEALKEATNIVGCKYKSYLNSLYSDLKKLKG